MKKYIFALFIFLCFGFCVFAQEEIEGREIDNRFYLGLGWSNIQSTGDFWGSIDFGFLLYKNKDRNFNIRNAILFDAGLLNYKGVENAAFSLSDKLMIEHMSQNKLFRYYSFFQGGVVLYGNENRGISQTPVTYNLGIGIGLDFFIQKNTSFFLDYTALFNAWENKLTWNDSFNPKFTMGMRMFF